MSRPRLLLRLVIILGFIVVGASIGVYFQAMRITEKPQEFRSLAKLVVEAAPSYKGSTREELNDFYGTVIETAESADMNRRALERVRALHPELEECDVRIRATRSKDSGIISLLAVGSEPRYTKIFLDALLDEFLAFRQSIREQSMGKSVQTFLQGVVDAQRRMEDLQVVMEKARAKAGILPAKAEHERVVARLTSFRNQRDDLRLELKALAAGEPSRAALETKAQLVDQEIQVLEAAANAFEQATAEFQTASENHKQAQMAYEKLFESVQQFQDSFNTRGDNVAIQERATTAAENVEDWVLPIAIGAGAGGLLGALAGILMTAALSGAASPPPKND